MAPEERTVLIITSSCGGGLIQAAIAKEQQEKEKDPHARIIKRDMMRDWYSKLVGINGIKAWDRAQKRGDVKTLEWILNMQWLADILFWPRIFITSLATFFKYEIDHVIDTQPVGTSAILTAIRVYNRSKKKAVVLEKVAVDLPTERNTHFFTPIKKLSAKNRKQLRLVTIQPLLEENQTNEQFWQKHCNLSEEQVLYQPYFVRENFRKLQGKERSGKVCLTAQIANAEEKQFLTKVLQKGSIRAEIEEKQVRFHINAQDKVLAILLGSQPSMQGTIGYVRRMIRLAKEEGSSKAPIHLFVLCGEHRVGEGSLFREVSQIALRMQKYPSHLSLIPLSFQSDAFIAPLFHRCDATCTKCGGQTSMELMCLSRGEIWIHSEAKKGSSLEELLKGIPGWEAGSALYLHKLHQAKIVTPEIFAPYARQIFKR